MNLICPIRSSRPGPVPLDIHEKRSPGTQQRLLSPVTGGVSVLPSLTSSLYLAFPITEHTKQESRVQGKVPEGDLSTLCAELLTDETVGLNPYNNAGGF